MYQPRTVLVSAQCTRVRLFGCLQIVVQALNLVSLYAIGISEYFTKYPDPYLPTPTLP